MNKYIWVFIVMSSWLQAEPSAGLTPDQALSKMLRHAQTTVEIDQWQQSPARLGVSHLATGSGLNAGGDESEINLTLSWNSPDNRQYLASLDSGLKERQNLTLGYVKWQLAGELRREWVNLAKLATLVEFQSQQAEKLQVMFVKTKAAFAAKEITRIELLLMENALTEAEQQVAVTMTQIEVAQQAYQQLSGQTQWPLQWQETVRATDWQQHPLLLLQYHDVLLAESAFVRDSGGDNEPWQTGILLRKTQGIGALPDDTAVGLQFSMPFGGASGTEQSALAQQQMHQQQNSLAEATRQVRTTWFAAQAQLQSSEIALKSSNEQWRRAKEIQAAADTALASGEITQTEWLRLFLQNHDLEKKARLAAIVCAASVAEFNQAGGLTW